MSQIINILSHFGCDIYTMLNVAISVLKTGRIRSGWDGFLWDGGF
jgi:hypothetical protein